jgi:ADP-ribosylglycohydrolase
MLTIEAAAVRQSQAKKAGGSSGSVAYCGTHLGMDVTRDRCAGALLGLALGDALGAPHEGGVLERLLWRAIGRTRSGHMRWTDDTQMSLDLAESLIDRGCVDPDDVARRFAAGYRWSRGYGAGAAKMLRRVRRGMPWQEAARSVFRDGSFGNGGAMRAPVVGVFCARAPDDLVEAARVTARITHAHPLGIEGAVLIATATCRALVSADPLDVFGFAAGHAEQREFHARLDVARSWLTDGTVPAAAEVGTRLGRGVAAAESCVTALYLGAAFLARPFVELLAFVASCGGDADTIGAMAGAIWGAANGASRLPGEHLESLEQRDRLAQVAAALHERITRGGG